MITKKNPQEIEHLREGGLRLAAILHELSAMVAPGLSTLALDQKAAELVAAGGDKSAFLNFKPYGAKRPYPATLCVSINDAIVHGIPNENPATLKEGDIVSLDMGLVHRGMYVDSAVTVPVGKIDAASAKLLEVTKKALEIGIAACKAGATTGDVGFAIESYVRPHGYGIIEELAGHGVGYKVHEDPYVPNYGRRGEGETLEAGVVLAIEPMLNAGTKKIVLDQDGYTYRTADGSRSAHFEHTIVITAKGPEILTQ
jgi:methionyl aminopeptidase